MQYRVSCIVIVALETPTCRFVWRTTSRFEVGLEGTGTGTCQQNRKEDGDPEVGVAALPEPQRAIADAASEKRNNVEKDLVGLGVINPPNSSKNQRHHQQWYQSSGTSESAVFCTYAEFPRKGGVHVRSAQVTWIYRTKKVETGETLTRIYIFTYVHIKVSTEKCLLADERTKVDSELTGRGLEGLLELKQVFRGCSREVDCEIVFVIVAKRDAAM